MNVPTGETPLQAFASGAMWTGLLYAWPLLMGGLLRGARRPGLLRMAGLATMVATTGRGLVLRVAHLAAVRAAGDGLTGRDIAMLADPIDWAIIIFGLVLCVRAWRLADAAR